METNLDYNTEGKPLRINELNIEGLAQWLHDKKIRTSQGKIIQPLHDGHREVVEDGGRYKVLSCGRRWGKTLLTSLVALAVLMQMRRRVWIVAPDYSLAEKVFRELYNILVRQLGLIKPGKTNGGRARSQKGEYYLETPWGSVLEAKSMENPDSLAGEANDLVIIDEAALNDQLEDIFIQMIKPTLIDKEGSAMFISTPRGKNSFYKLYLTGQKGMRQRKGELEIITDEQHNVNDDMTEWSSFQKTSYDNPLLASTPEKSKEEIDKAYREAVHSGKVIKFKQEYLADFEAVSDSCFPGFIVESTKEHKYPNVVDYNWHPDSGTIFASCDLNYAKPSSTIYAQINKFNDVMIFGEDFTPHTTSYMQAQHILDKQNYLQKLAKDIWKKEEVPLEYWYKIRFQEVIADISGNQRQLNGRSAWDDFEEILNKRPVGLKQPREVGCDMIRHWLQFPLFDEKGRPLLKDNNEPKTAPKLFISRNCTNLIYAITTAKFKKTKAGALKEDYEEVPEGYEGLLDALRYLLVYLFHDRGQHFTITKGF